MLNFIAALILQKLPYSSLSENRNTPPVYSDHYLFTERITGKYEYPEQVSGFGLLSISNGSGNCFINGTKNLIDTRHYAVVNYGSSLAAKVQKAETEPAFLFFHSGLASVVKQSLLYSQEQLLEAGTSIDELQFANEPIDFSYIERLHLKTDAINNHLQLLPLLGNSCSSFHSLKADAIIRLILEELLISNIHAAKRALKLDVIKKTTRVELFRRLVLSREWIEANYFLPVTLSQMASVAMLNSQHFLRMFSQCYDITPHKFLVQVRLEQSKKRLAETGESIIDICTGVGFESVSTFTGLFKKRFGISPGEFRRQA
ncbi:MAG TPA: AraC family transcriptional regulator [Chitinophagaceae bacterium]